jgi:hypothetical protein
MRFRNTGRNGTIFYDPDPHCFYCHGSSGNEIDIPKFFKSTFTIIGPAADL